MRWFLPVLILLAGASLAVPRPALAAPDAPRWVRHELIHPEVSDVAVDAAGAVWVRSGGARRAANDLVLGISRTGRPQVQGSVTTVVAGRFEIIRRQGDLADFWAVDGQGRAWVGPTFYNGRVWTVVDRDTEAPVGALQYDYRTAADPTGLAWVPFIAYPSCPSPEPCDRRGLRAFDARGQANGIVFEPMYEADAWKVADVHLVAAAPGGTDPTAKPTLFAAARTAFYRLPANEGVSYPLLGPPSSPAQLRNAGYATAAARRPDGRAQVITWVELQRPEAVDYRIFANTWTDGQGWDSPEDWTEAPLVGGDAKSLRIVAAAWSPVLGAADQAALWVASSSGGVARRTGGKWVLLFGAEDVGLPDGARIRALAIGWDGTVWLASDTGLYTYGEIAPMPPPARVYLPAALCFKETP